MKAAMRAALLLLSVLPIESSYAADLGQRGYTKAPVVDPVFDCAAASAIISIAARLLPVTDFESRSHRAAHIEACSAAVCAAPHHHA
ncbi:hypothetical protein [Bradyrhizobium sp. SYSU BS000235]|uniref:hypothetical protein n=1 Tax=Bradyrhizobium sp. SYSU BS000235 TaxID=3411332 RepID=UPI003C77141A